MTTKLKFIEAACAVFNTTPAVVLNAVSGGVTQHPETAKEIKRWADNSCNATKAEWKAFAKACETQIAHEILWGMVSGADVKVSPLP